MSVFTQFIKDYGAAFGVTGALIIYGLGRINAYFERKRNFRAYLKVEEINTNYKLANFNFNKGSKLILTDEYKPIMKKLKELNLDKDKDFIKGTYFGYLQFKNIGPGIIISASVEIIMSSATKTWSTSFDLPFMEEGEEIYVSTDNIEVLDEKYFLDQIIVEYKTQQNEKIKYERESKQDPDYPERNKFKDSYYVKLPLINFYKKKHTTKGNEGEWIYL